MAKLQYGGTFRSNTSQIEVQLSLLTFEEDGVIIYYSPALDLSGYGKNNREAKESFNIALEEFLQYTLNKATLKSVLKNLGWKLSGKGKTIKYQQPFLDHMLAENKYLSSVVREKEFQRINQTIYLPIAA